ncbi:ECF transporter S component [Peptoniphilus asaccharolyticus]
MKNSATKELVLSALFIALGVVLPMVFHAIGAGPVFLPMHIPVLLAGFFLSVPYAALVGILTPILSSVITGMPPMFPVLPFMVFELLTYGVVVSYMYRKMKVNIFVALISAMVAGRIAAGIVVWVLATFFMAKLPAPTVFITGAIAKGIPGIIIQLVFIPAIVYMLKKQKSVAR